MAEENPKNRSKIIAAVNAPLGFFVLALLIIEAFLGSVLTIGSLDADNKMKGLYLGCSLFIIVILIVSFLVWHKAENLIFDQDNLLSMKKFMVQQDSFKGASEPASISDETPIEI